MQRPVIMTVDDDASVLGALGRDLLARYGERFDVRRLASAAVAEQELQQLRLQGVPVALLLVDQRMPGMTGIELLRRARRLYPDARRVLLTAYADTDAAIAAINEVGLDQYLLKPWHPPEERLYPPLDDLLEEWTARATPADAGIRVVSSRWSAEGHHVRDFLARNLVPHSWLDLEDDDGAAALLNAAARGAEPRLPLVVLDDGTVMERPSDPELAARIGFASQTHDDLYDVVIAGAGPAGLAAAVHASSEGYRVLLVEQHAPGGQAGLSARIENYLGFPVGLSGGELARRALAQARRFGAELVSPVSVEGLRLHAGMPVLSLSNGLQVTGRTLLVATGVQYHRSEVLGVDRLSGAGVYYGGALTEALRVAGRDVHILGGGNSAGQAALHLSRFARSVTLLVRGARLTSTMSQYLRERIEQARNIHVRAECAVEAAEGTARLERLRVRDVATGVVETLATSSLFIFIGASAQTDWADGVLARDPRGFIYSGADVMRDGHRPGGWSAPRDPFHLETNVAGIFVAGDVRHGLVKGVAAAVGDGNMAAQLLHQHLNALALRLPDRQPPMAMAAAGA
jgi:thioredoxin reductase (NADPH)